ncbi:MAG: tRNA 2-thiouridine(34) synthase MnmA [Pseudomonadota bacterium]|nr:tRNA 2-thiouridine(34) synthase MnmA [Pseudomonadota bacterium]MDP1903331.1 tRNA 2-thiouridine(34) synthase MnmA [Pseudomonadota bacterium]MDP2354221.1 tRNA 2-thiouridine(34) synthase MnmA [Pseudomonadota bacterium]
MSKIVVGLSGGVDSAVTAWLLKQAGHEVVGIFMKNWEADDLEDDCPIAQDFRDVLAIGEVLGIEIEQVNFSREYQERVFAYFLAEYQAGRTPNPDVLCNAEIKFKAFLDHAISLGAEHLATGHYARLEGESPNRRLLKAVDGNKDQSYFLYRLNQAQIAPALFPLGDLPKPRVRELARQAGLPVAEKKDSTGICFIGERPFREFLQRYLPTQPGNMVTPEGKVMGRHQGLMYHTLGQRKGLGIGGVKDNEGDEPWFAAGKNLERNELIVVQGHDHPLLLSATLRADQLSWIGAPPEAGRRYGAKTRYRQQDAACVVESITADELVLRFEQAQWAVTPGQSVVLYDGEVCLGGGVIAAAEPMIGVGKD